MHSKKRGKKEGKQPNLIFHFGVQFPNSKGMQCIPKAFSKWAFRLSIKKECTANIETLYSALRGMVW